MTATMPTDKDVRRLFGDVEDDVVVEILAAAARIEDLEDAAAYLEGESDVMGEQRHPLSGRVAIVYEIVSRGLRRRAEERPQQGG